MRTEPTKVEKSADNENEQRGLSPAEKEGIWKRSLFFGGVILLSAGVITIVLDTNIAPEAYHFQLIGYSLALITFSGLFIFALGLEVRKKAVYD